MQPLVAKIRTTLLALLCLLPCAPQTHAEEAQAQEIRDLRYGEILYNFYQQKYFSAITELLVTQQRKPIEVQGEDPKLLLGGLYLSYGMHDQASRLFDDVLSSSSLPATHDRAWYYIAKLRYIKGYFPAAETALLKIQHYLPPDREAERLHLLSNIYLSNQQYDKAIEILRDFKGDSEWQTYAQFNLGVALIKAGQTNEGITVLDKVGSLNPSKINYELNGLRDKANLALGFANLREKKPQDAAKDFERIRINGPLSNKALLGMGWALTAQNEYKEALTPWMELQSRRALDTSVQESLLAIPYTLEKLEKPKLALQYYQKAIDTYSQEITRMADIIKAVQSGELTKAMRPANYDDETSMPAHTFGLPNSVTTPYLYQLMATHPFQEAYKDYQNLLHLQYVLNNWLGQLPAYELMLSERRKAYFEKLPQLGSNSRLLQINQMQTERDKFAAEITRIENTHDVFALASTGEIEKLALVNKLKEHLGAPDSFGPQPTPDQERFRFAYGVLYWNIYEDFPARLWEAKKQLKALDKAIEAAKKTKQSLILTANQAPQYFQGYDARITAARQRISVLLQQLDATIKEQERYIQTLALIALQQSNQQLENYHIRARFAVARLYDALTKQQEGSHGKE
ncbi:MAG: tetratricopeptide repeat protein [Gammaproteobacteria bacterium]|nr:tetratricopeptide repeat protein [Gammaproteobacteria bacterium]